MIVTPSSGLPEPNGGTPAPLVWTPADGAATLHRGLAEQGIARLAANTALDSSEARRSPWSFVERLLGERPALVEHQAIKSLPNGRNFATSKIPAPFHTDSQCFLGVPPHLQLMLCIQPAELGGENRYLDSWALLERLEREEPELLEECFTRHRRIPFVFGDFFGPTVAWRGGSLVFTQAAQKIPGDELAPRVARWLDRTAAIEFAASAGELVAIHNHRMLHGRNGFADEGREFLRLLVWLPRPFPSPPRFASRAARAHQKAALRLADSPDFIRRRFGLETTEFVSPAARRLEIVLEMLRGVPPGLLARRERIDESELYRWRDSALASARGALAGEETIEEQDQELERALRLLR